MIAEKQRVRKWREPLTIFMNKWGLFLLVLIITAILHFTKIGSIPGGLFPDEAANGLDINRIFKGHLQPFYERGNGREALFFYILAASVAVFGRSPFAHHLVTALVSLGVVALTFLVIRRWFGTRMAFVASFLTAVSSWYMALTRNAFRANTAPLLTMLFLYFATRVVQAKSKNEYYWSAALSGLFFGLGFYTYISYRMIIPIVLGAAVMLLILDGRSKERWQLLKRFWKAILTGIATGLATISWLMFFFYRNPEWLGGRAGQVSIFNKDLNHGDLIGTFLGVLKKTLLGFITQGDLNWRHNISGYPFLSYLVAPIFVAGLVLVLAQALVFFGNCFRKLTPMDKALNLKRFPYFLLLLWFGFMLVPEVLTDEGIPHGLRLIGVIPVVFIIAALFIEEIYTVLPHEASAKGFVRKYLFNGLLVVWLVCEGIYGVHLFYDIAAKSPDYAFAYRSDLTTVSKYLNERHDKNKTYLVIDMFSEQTPQYLTTTTGQPYKIIDPATLWSGPAQTKIISSVAEQYNPTYGLALHHGDQVVFTQSTIYDTQAFTRFFPEAKLINITYNNWQEKVMEVYQEP